MLAAELDLIFAYVNLLLFLVFPFLMLLSSLQLNDFSSTRKKRQTKKEQRELDAARGGDFVRGKKQGKSEVGI